MNEALKRLAARGKLEPLDPEPYDGEEGAMPVFHSELPTPETSAARKELSSLLEEAILALPLAYREVIVLRDVEEMSTAETAEVLSITDTNVKVRLHRAHELLRGELLARAGGSAPHAFEFHAIRCDRVVRAVFERLDRGDMRQ